MRARSFHWAGPIELRESQIPKTNGASLMGQLRSLHKQSAVDYFLEEDFLAGAFLLLGGGSSALAGAS